MAYLELVDEEYVAKEREARTPEPVAVAEPEPEPETEEVFDTEVSDTVAEEEPVAAEEATDEESAG
jgi:hypothetical protein